MNTLSADKQAAILRALVEGNSIRATARMVGCAKRTVPNLLRDVGAHCKNYHGRFVGCKERQVPNEERGQGRGDVLWTFTALCRDSKVLIAYRIGNRDSENALAFMDDLADRVKGRIQLTTDGHSMYPWRWNWRLGGAAWTMLRSTRSTARAPRVSGATVRPSALGARSAGSWVARTPTWFQRRTSSGRTSPCGWGCAGSRA